MWPLMFCYGKQELSSKKQQQKIQQWDKTKLKIKLKL